MSDIQGSASLDVQQVLVGLRQLQAGITGVTNGMTRLNHESDKTKRTLKDTFKDSSAVAGKAGGPLGSYSSKLLGGASMGDAFGRIAVGLSVATVGFRAYQSVVEAAIDRTRLFIEAQKNVRDVSDQTGKAVEGMARKGEANIYARQDVIALGKGAEDDADMMAGSGAMTTEQANSVAAILHGRFGDNPTRAKNAVDLAMRGAMGGLDPVEVAKELTRHGGAIDDESQSDRLLGRIAMEKTGGRGNPEEILKARVSNLGGNAEVQEMRKQWKARSVVNKLERNAFMGSGLGQKDAAQAGGPGGFYESEAFSKHTQAVEDLKKLAESQGFAARVLADVFQSGGSFQTQVDRLINANAAARGLGPPARKVAPPVSEALDAMDGLGAFGP